MLIAVTVASILGLTVLVWLVNRILPFAVCPICAGVSGTWLWLMVAYFWGYPVVLTIPALLLGGTVVGAMSKLERFVEPKFVLVWKTAFVISGFWAANGLITGNWLIFAMGIILTLAATLTCKIRKIKIDKPESERVEKLKNKMENCC